MRVLLVLSLLVCLTTGLGASDAGFSLAQVSEVFPSAGFELPIQFWKDIFAEYPSNRVLLHDEFDLSLVYRVIEFQRAPGADGNEAKRQKDYLKHRVKELQGHFDSILKLGVNHPSLKPEQKALLEVFGKAGYRVTPDLLRQKRQSIRTQRGVRDKFAEGLIRSGQYLPWIEKVFTDAGLPVELAALPHVESSFDYNAHSHAAAAGIWQFTRSTGRLYLGISKSVDERLDPIRSTQAAARLFRDNHAALGHWPLTVTSYNHGKGGMLRAQKEFGNNLAAIVKNYKSKTFGFASRNFYFEFLAALEISRNYRAYFGELPILPAVEFDSIRFPRTVAVAKLGTISGITSESLVHLNPHLRKVITAGRKSVPKGIELRVPAGTGEQVRNLFAGEVTVPSNSIARLPQDGEVRYEVERGDSLSLIARKFNVTVGEVEAWNGLEDRHMIHPGQILLIKREKPGSVPSPAASPATASSAAVSSQESGGASRASSAYGSVPRVYVVQSGDTVERIARKFGTSVDRIAKANSLKNAHKIFPGQKLVIP